MAQGDALKLWRNKHGLTQADAARAGGVGLSTWCQWEQGLHQGPPTSVLVKLERRFPGLMAALRDHL